jgi:hypothetical protein
MKKIIGIGVLIALLAGGFYAYKEYTKPFVDAATTAEDISTSATDLFTAFSTDEAAANPKYLDKIIKVCGKVAENSVTENGSTTIQLETGDAMGVVMCELDAEAKQSKTSFTKGEEVCFKGFCSGYMTDVLLNRCAFVAK